MRKLLSIICFLFITHLSYGQTFTQTFVDRCTGEVQVVTANFATGSAIVAFYDEAKLFTYQQYTNGELHQWLTQKYAWWQALSPCSQAQTNATNAQNTANNATSNATNATNNTNTSNTNTGGSTSSGTSRRSGSSSAISARGSWTLQSTTFSTRVASKRRKASVPYASTSLEPSVSHLMNNHYFETLLRPETLPAAA